MENEFNEKDENPAADEAAAGINSTVEPQLTEAEARVVAVLMEKSITTPKYYPMTVNAITQASNQKSSRNPVMSLTEGEVGHALLSLLDKELVRRDDSSPRATKWEQRLKYRYQLQPSGAAVLVASMLRGPQTRAELRAHAAPLGGPESGEALEEALDKMMGRGAPLLVEFARQPGQKEARLMHRVCGEPDAPAADMVSVGRGASSAGNAALNAALEARVAELETRLARLESQLGIEAEGD